MKRGDKENLADADGPDPKRKRGPRGTYLKWAREGQKIPRNTQHYRSKAASAASNIATTHSRINRKPGPVRRKNLGQSNTGNLPKAATIIKDLKQPSIQANSFVDENLETLQTSSCIKIPQNSESCSISPHLQDPEENISEQQEHRVQLETELEVEPHSDTEAGSHEDLSALDGFQQIEDENSDTEIDNDDGHSEDSFIFWTDENQDEPLVAQAIQEPPEPPNDDSSSDDDEDLVDADVNLSINHKIQLLLVLSTMKRHNMTYTAAEDIMELSGVLSWGENDFHLTRHIMKRAIEKYSCPLTEHHMCPSCDKYVGIKKTPRFTCASCGTNVDTSLNRKQGNIFLYISLEDQLKALLEHCSERLVDPNERQKISNHHCEDIYDGQFYKNLTINGALTFNFFVDGLQYASTCKRSAWPILICLNELPVHLRRKNILMASLWLSKKKPLCNEYMKPFVEESTRLAERGITFLRNNVRVHMPVKPLMCVADTIARPMLRNSIQFNGRFGCGLCVHPGFKMRHLRGHTRSYSTLERHYPLRTHDDIMAMAGRARLGHPVMGIKGVSILSNIPEFDMARCLDLDLFHALVNVAKRFANLWFLDKFSGRPYSVHDKFDEINARFLQITPTSDVSRHPRSLNERTDFRGHEWFHWVIEYSIPVLKYYLPARYLNHWALLVYGIVLLMQSSVSKSEIVYSGRFLSRFVSEIDHLYGKQHVTISVHLLTHLEASVRDFGQPWSHSAFIFESFNAEIKQTVKSSNGVAQQICRGVQRKIALQKLEESVKDSMNDQQREFLEKTKFTGLRLADPHLTIGPAELLGKPKHTRLPAESVTALQRAGVNCNERSSFLLYDRCILNSDMIHSTNYKRVFKQNNTVVLLESDDVFIVKTFVVFENNCFALGNYVLKNRNQSLCDITLPHIKILKERMEGTLRCIPVSQIQYKLLSFTIQSPSKQPLRIACINVLGMEMLR